MLVDTGVLVHDVRTFIFAYALAVGTAFLPADLVWPRSIVAVVLIGIYAWYVRGHLRGEPASGDGDLAPLRRSRRHANKRMDQSGRGRPLVAGLAPPDVSA